MFVQVQVQYTQHNNLPNEIALKCRGNLRGQGCYMGEGNNNLPNNSRGYCD